MVVCVCVLCDRTNITFCIVKYTVVQKMPPYNNRTFKVYCTLVNRDLAEALATCDVYATDSSVNSALN